MGYKLGRFCNEFVIVVATFRKHFKTHFLTLAY